MRAEPPGEALLSDVIGRLAVDPAGNGLGKVADLTVRVGSPHPIVERVVVRRRRVWTRAFRWSGAVRPGEAVTVAQADPDDAVVETSDAWLRPDELRLGRDVLDTQVVDLRGSRLARVSDVILVSRPGGGLEVAAVDLGFMALARRIGLGRLATRLGAREVAVDWQDLHLTSSRGHTLQLSIAAARYRALDAEELARLLARLRTARAIDVLTTVSPRRAADAVGRSHPFTAGRLLRGTPNHELHALLEAAPDDQALRLRASSVRGRGRRGHRFARTAGWRAHRPPAEHLRPPTDAVDHG